MALILLLPTLLIYEVQRYLDFDDLLPPSSFPSCLSLFLQNFFMVLGYFFMFLASILSLLNSLLGLSPLGIFQIVASTELTLFLQLDSIIHYDSSESFSSMHVLLNSACNHCYKTYDFIYHSFIEHSFYILT